MYVCVCKVIGISMYMHFAHLGYKFIQPIYGQCSLYVHLRKTEITSLVFWGSQRMWDGSIFQKIGQSLTWFMGCGVSLVDVFEDNTNKSAGFLQTCVEFS